MAVAVTASLGSIGWSAGTAGAATKPSAKLAAYCAQVKQIGDAFGDPGIDAIFQGNPNPTLAQWAAFLPGPIAKMRKFANDVVATDPPQILASKVALAVKRMRAVADLFERARQFAAAGDQRAFDAVGKGRDALVKKLEKAMGRVGKVCGFEDGSTQ